MKQPILISILLLTTLFSTAQQDTTSPLTFSGYIEAYYSYDFNQPADHNRPPFVYSFNRHNETALNLGLLKATYREGAVRANLGLMAGSYANANLSAEPGVLKNIFEANVGLKISKKNNTWIDAGIFASHIGFESAIGKDCWNLTRSILADNSPYYESGVKISYTSPNEKWFLSGLVLNGWQRIQRVDGNSTPAFGHQLTFTPNDRVTLNSSSFIGNDKPDSTRQMRYFHNFYGIFKLNKKVALTAGFDIGAEQTAKGSSSYNTWYTPVIIVKLNASEKSSVAARVEYYRDPAGVIISTGTPNGFRTWGYSLNYDLAARKNILWRIEGRYLSGKDKTFIKENSAVNTDFILTTSLAISF